MSENRRPYLVPAETLATWRALLWELRVQYPDCFIAGGCVRDAIYRREPKDIDVFTWLPLDENHLTKPTDNPFVSEVDLANVDIALLEGTRESKRLTAVSKYMGFDHGGASHLYQIVQASNQLYEPGNVQGLVKQFGLGVQQAWFDGEQVHTTEAFDMNYRLKCITVEHCESDLEMQRLLRKVFRIWQHDGSRTGELIIKPAWFEHLDVGRRIG